MVSIRSRNQPQAYSNTDPSSRSMTGSPGRPQKQMMGPNAAPFFSGALAGGILVVALFLVLQQSSGSESLHIKASSDCRIPLGKYRGKEYTEGSLSKPKCLVESKFMKVSLHEVKLPGNPQVINDWLWVDYHDRVNVLAQTTKNEFLVFEQTKYALEGRSSLAIVGGISEPKEDIKDTARREVQEELHQNCKEFIFLGRYRTDVNRGVGWLNSFLAVGCETHVDKAVSEEDQSEQVGAADTETQVLKKLSIKELREAYKDGKFLEVQWTATIGLALQHEKLKN